VEHGATFVSDGAPRVILQDLRSFTVQIRHSTIDQVVGTGIVVSTGGLVVTCDHVAKAAGVDPRSPNDATVGVYFPKRRGREAERRRAAVKACFPDSDDDIVVLQLIDGTLPLAPQQIAILGSADESRWHRFESYGYRRLDRYLGGRAGGTILGDVDAPEGYVLLLDPIQLESSQINAGMSGSAVLDTERNLVVGIVSQTWFPGDSPKDRDTAWAVDGGVLSFSPVNLALREEPLPLLKAPQVELDPASIYPMAIAAPGRRMEDSPPLLREWVGREEILKQLKEYWRSEDYLVAGLIGFGGEGKSSLARRWLDALFADPAARQPDGVFWWSFREGGGTDEFLGAALGYMTGGRVDLGEYPSSGGRARLAAGLLGAKRYIFVLDGLEVAQHQQGDQFGGLANEDLRAFLTWFATPGHRSFCLVTSRAPVLDLAPYITYRHIDLDSLGIADGRELLRKLGVLGADAALDRVVRDWSGHALTLSLLASYMVKRYGGDIRRVEAIPSPDPALPRGELVQQMLHEYDRHLGRAEREFLIRFSVFRIPVNEAALKVVLEDQKNDVVPGEDTSGLQDVMIPAVLKRLVVSRILQRDANGTRYAMHPLVRDFYLRLAVASRLNIKRTHDRLKHYYLSISSHIPDRPGIDDLTPLIEAAHHACAAGQYDEACDIIYEHLYRGDRGMLAREMGAYDLALAMINEFFPNGELRREPLLQDAVSQRWVLNEAGTCLQLLGRLSEAASVIQRAKVIAQQMKEWHNAGISCQNLAELQFYLGALSAVSQTVREAFRFARHAGDKEDELVAHTISGALSYLRGSLEKAGQAFAAALELATAFTPIPALYSSSGIRYGEYLRRAGNPMEALNVAQKNLRICEHAGWRGDVGECHVLLGQLAEDAEDHANAAEHYETAFQIARAITRRDVLIKSLLAKGRWATRWGSFEDAQSDLDQALALAVLGPYRLTEIDVRIGLARLHRRVGDADIAWAEGERALQMSVETGYYWGRADVTELLRELDDTT
jgi:tetratricopeptide (TPR) repeat protein